MPNIPYTYTFLNKGFGPPVGHYQFQRRASLQTPKFGEDSYFDEYFSDGLVQPPTRISWFITPSTKLTGTVPLLIPPKGQCRLPVTSNEVPMLLRCHWSSAHCHPEGIDGRHRWCKVSAMVHGQHQNSIVQFLEFEHSEHFMSILTCFPNKGCCERFKLNMVRHRLYSILPIGSMGLVFLPTLMVDLYGKCRQIYRSSHGSYELYFSMFLLMLPRYNRDEQGSIWLFSNLQKYAKKLPIENKT